MGFQMLIPEQVQKPKPVDNKPLKVKNLIDFSECDVTSEEIIERPRQDLSSSSDAVASRLLVDQESALPGCPVVGMAPARQGSMMQPDDLGASLHEPADMGGAARGSLTAAQPAQQGLQEELLAEIEHLRQMLADANEEKSIQVAIVQDEVIEKQQLVEDLRRRRDETEVQLRHVRDRVDALEAQAAQAAAERDEAWAYANKRREEAELHTAEAQEMRTQVEHLRAELAQVQAASATQIQEAPPAAAEIPPSVAGIMNELREMCSRTQEALGGNSQPPEQGAFLPAAEDATNAGELEAGLRSLIAELGAVHAAAQHASADRRQLTVKLRDLEKALLTKRSIHSEPTPMRNGVVASEEHAVAQDMGRQAAQALKEMRINAEQQLEWITKRIRMSRSQVAGGQVLSACLVRTDEPCGDRTTASLTP